MGVIVIHRHPSSSFVEAVAAPRGVEGGVRMAGLAGLAAAVVVARWTRARACVGRSHGMFMSVHVCVQLKIRLELRRCVVRGERASPPSTPPTPRRRSSERTMAPPYARTHARCDSMSAERAPRRADCLAEMSPVGERGREGGGAHFFTGCPPTVNERALIARHRPRGAGQACQPSTCCCHWPPAPAPSATRSYTKSASGHRVAVTSWW